MAESLDKDMDKDSEEFEHEPSALDEASHREMALIYDDATRTITYAKGIQWRAVASTMLVFLALAAVGKYISSAADFISLLKGTVILFATASIFALIVFQSWQLTEAKKIRVVEQNFSSTFRLARDKKWRLEANIHRYILLFLMILAVLFTAFLTFRALSNIAGV